MKATDRNAAKILNNAISTISVQIKFLHIFFVYMSFIFVYKLKWHSNKYLQKQ